MAADNAILVDRGDDLEISFLVQERRVISRDLSGDAPLDMVGGKYTLSPHIVEIGKVRISPEVGVNLAMSILSEAMDADRINLTAFQSAIQKMIDDHREDNDRMPLKKPLRRNNKSAVKKK